MPYQRLPQYESALWGAATALEAKYHGIQARSAGSEELGTVMTITLADDSDSDAVLAEARSAWRITTRQDPSLDPEPGGWTLGIPE